MCYKSPGPRCSADAERKLERAYGGDSAESLAAALHAWYLTPRGIQGLRDDGNEALADHYAAERQELIGQVRA